MITEPASTWTYLVYGLRVVTNRPVAGLIASPKPEMGDVQVEFAGVEQGQEWPATRLVLYSSSGIAANGEPFLQIAKDERSEHAYLFLRYTDGFGTATFVGNRYGSKVRVAWSETISFEDVSAYFLGPMPGCILRLRRITCLHAGVVVVGEQAVAIIGPKGAGKSTAILALADRGHAVLSDDIAALSFDEGTFLVQPGYPRLRLWPATIDAMTGVATDGLVRVLSAYEKRYLELTLDRYPFRWRFRREPQPLAAVYSLGQRTEVEAFSIRPVGRAESMISLTRNTYADYMLDQVGRAGDFKLLGMLAATVPLRHVERPEGLEALPAFCDAIIQDVQTVS